jgi:formylglycine-generating enzyme required for sulfatase activity/tRNA A-37 threonylcarbamoyl transferase component Bud32
MEANITQIGKYQITGVLGRGAMGVVYQGFDPMIRRYVAIKTIASPELENAGNEIYLRFQREAQAAGNLSHPNIVSIYEFGEDAGMAYIVMEHIEGQTLSDRMKQTDGLTVEESTGIIKGVLSALSHAHAMGVVHRDIKPANIIIAGNGIVKVADFGIARIEASDLTQAGTIIGTPGYMSPEQLKGETVDARSDLFSVGVILYEMLTGQKAFPGDTMASIIYNVINKELPPPSELRIAVPAGLDAVVLRAVAKSAADRFESSRQFAEAIDAVLEKHAEPLRFARPQTNAPTTDRSDRPTIVEQPSRRRSGRGLWIGLGGLAGVAVLIGFFMLRPGPAPDKKEIAKQQYQPGDTFQDCDTCPAMVVIPSGQFVQGTPSAQETQASREGPVHLVSIDHPFAMGRFEITRQQFGRFAAETGFTADGCDVYDGQWVQQATMNWQSPGFDQGQNHPATCVSWDDAQAYVQWLSSKTGHTYRLLSASEWEYAARDGGRTSGRFNDDANSICQKANVADRSAGEQYTGWQVFDCKDSFVHTAPVGSFRPNKLGVYDMAGNVFEWVADCWNENYQKAPTNGVAWAGGDCSRHVLRGGSWFSRPEYLRATFRNSFPAEYRSSSFGFRVAREIP